MQVVIFAGGLGTRISEETIVRPKPLIEIGGKPIIWHIMKIYSFYGLNDFIICAGYKGYLIKEYFNNYFIHNNDVTFNIKNNSFQIHKVKSEPWKVSVINTGENTMTGGRLKRILPYINNENFCLTYGDGVGNIDIRSLIEFHLKRGLKATLTSAKQPARFGAINYKDGKIISFREKPEENNSHVNAGFFVLNKKISNYLENDETVWEEKPLESLAKEKQLGAWQHNGFWHPMDTLRDKIKLEKLWEEKKAPWKIW